MRRTYKLEGDICGNCAAKIQNKISAIDGVNDVKVNVMTLRFTLDAQDERFNDILTESIAIFNRIEPDCTVIAGNRQPA